MLNTYLKISVEPKLLFNIMDIQKSSNNSFYEYSSIDEGSMSEGSKSDAQIENFCLPLNDKRKLCLSKIDPSITVRMNSLMTKDKLNLTDHMEFKGNYNSILQTPLGGKVIQNALQNTSYAIIVEIFEEIKSNLPEHFKGTYSKFCVQKLYGYLNSDSQGEQHKTKYLQILFRRLVEVSCNKEGTFALQKLMDMFQSNQEFNSLQLCLKILSEEEILKMANVSTLI